MFSLEALASPGLLGEQLVLLVSTPSVDAVQLPPCKIAVGELTVRRSLIFIGCPGVQLEVRNNPIELRAGTAPVTVKFVECAFTLNAENSRSPQTLFDVHEGTTLELQDCQLRTECTASQDSQQAEVAELCPVSKEQITTCIHMFDYETICVAKPEGDAKQATSPIAPAAVNLHSCSFLYFMRDIIADGNNSLCMEKCGFFKTQRTAIAVANPRNLYIEGSNIEDCGESGIELHWNKPAVLEELGAERELKIVNSYIAEITEHGIAIFGTNSSDEAYNARVSILGNRIQNCSKDGINMKDAYFAELTIATNNVSAITGNGLAIYRSGIPKLAIKANNIKNNQGTGIYCASTSCTISSCDCSSNMLSGIVINGCTIAEKKELIDTDVDIIDCVIKENAQNGLTVLDLHSGVVVIEKCMISGNKEYGLYLSNNEYLKARTMSLSRATTNANTNDPERKHRSRVSVEKGEISYNKYGLYLQQQYTYIDGTFVKGNAEYAVCMPNKASEQYLEVTPATSAKKCIQGLVGGPWGNAMANSRGDRCGCAVCTIV